MPTDLTQKRSSGILCHPSSLPGDYGIGDLGPGAYKFVDFLAATKQTLWQVLPFGPTHAGDYHSPYGALSAFAGNPLLISPEKLWKQGLLSKRSLTFLKDAVKAPKGSRVDFQKMTSLKELVLQEAFARSRRVVSKNELNHFRFKNDWVNDFAIFSALRKSIGKARDDWDLELRTKSEKVMRPKLAELSESMNFEIFCQYLFFKQWHELKAYANKKKVYLVGDIPIYVWSDSSDVWAHERFFALDPKTKRPRYISGVPPDRYNKEGQPWDHPVFDWTALEKENFSWWTDRLKWLNTAVDIIRIDHFRGLVKYWAMPGGAKSAKFGKWYDGPGAPFFDRLKKEMGKLPIVVEDLGFITPDVTELRDRYGFMGMKVMQFGFEGESLRDNPHVPFNFNENYVVSTSTHDSPTSRQWFEGLSGKNKKRLLSYLGDPLQRDFTREFIRSAMSSVARVCVTPVQDVLNLGREGRMNSPGTYDMKKNWGWRMTKIPDASTYSYLRDFTELYQRTDIFN